MTNYEKVIKNLDSSALTYWIWKANACPFPQQDCDTCTLWNEDEGRCELPDGMDMKEIMEWLEQEVE